MADDLKELKSQFIIDQGRFDEERIPLLIKRVLKFARVTSEGRVILQAKTSMNNINQIKLVLAARFLANKLEPSIKPEVSIDEVVDFTGIEIRQVSARISSLTNVDRFVIKNKRGIFSVAPFFIESFLDEIDKPQTNSYGSVIFGIDKPMRVVRNIPKGSGAISRIRKLKVENFFVEPKTIVDVRNALEHIGHVYKSSALSPALLFFIRNGELRRIKKDNQWAYVNL